MIDSVTIENFTVFRNAHFDFVSGINVFVGANASGKTHLLKLMYALQKGLSEGPEPTLADQSTLINVFNPESEFDLIRVAVDRKFAAVSARWNGVDHGLRLSINTEGHIGMFITGEPWAEVSTPVLIPVKDMLSHSLGFLSLYDQRYIDFDQTYRDILTMAFTPTLRTLAPEYREALDLLSDKIEGKVEVKGERFYLAGKSGRFEMHMVAEGWRKLALLYRLVENGSISAGTTLYWDEPETNLNPSLMDELVQVLLLLARKGTQIFLSSHNYLILKELELQKTSEDSLRMFAMDRSRDDGSVTPRPADSYIELKPNLIAEQFERIYDLEFDRAMGTGNGK